MSGPSPNLALIRHAVLEIVETADVFRCNVLIGRTIAAADRLAVVVEYMIREKALVVQSGWTCKLVIVDKRASAVQQELGFLVVVAVQH